MHDAPSRLDELILPNTDLDIIDRYHSLSSCYKGQRFALLEDELIMLDTETTGLDKQQAELIQVAAIRVCGEEILDEFCAYIKPKKPVPPNIEELTGIRNEFLEDAPDDQEVLTQFADFVRGAPIVAHNVSFDRYFLEKQSPVPLSDYWVDSLALARIALPRLSHHRLTDLCEAFGIEAQVTHNALDDARALAEVWRLLLTALTDFPEGLLERLAHMHPDKDWGLRPIFAQLSQLKPQGVFSLLSQRNERQFWFKQQFVGLDDARKLNYGEMGAGRRRSFEDAESSVLEFCEEGKLYIYPSQTQIDEEFEKEGLVGQMYEDYEPRAEQRKMALEINKAFSTSSHRAIEAGTGVGKSIAYLIPSIAFARSSMTTVGVATKTNALMDQLIYKELPLLSKAMQRRGEKLRYLALKGYDHYPCLRKLERFVASAADEHITDESLSMAATVMSFAVQSSVGDLDSINLQWSKLPKSEICTTSASCEKQRCPFFSARCFIHGQRKNAACMDVVLTNHALLFRQVESDYAILPPIRHWIVDEAHGVEEEARRQWGMQLSMQELKGSLDSLGSEKSGILGRIEALAQREAGVSLLSASITKLTQASSALRIRSLEFFQSLGALRAAVPAGSRGYEYHELWISDQLRLSELWQDLRATSLPFVDEVDHFKKLLADLLDILKSNYPPEISFSDLQTLHSQFVSYVKTLDFIFRNPQDRSVCSLQLDNRSESFEHSLRVEYLDVGEIFADKFYPEMESVIYTSATIAVGNDFKHFADSVGLNRLERGAYRSLQLDSSYNYKKNMEVVAVSDLALPNTTSYLDEMCEFLFAVHRGMGGSVLTLFTSRKEMEYIYDRLYPRLRAEGLELACQKRGMVVRQARDLFIKKEKSSLFALKSFWEGFDAQGDTLKCVVIPKLPFTPPTNPLSLQRRELDERAWMKYDLPESVISVKQAAGRLIRRSSDTGCLIIADTRVIKKGYGRHFLRSLPKRQYHSLPADKVEDFLRRWRDTDAQRS